MPLNLSAVVPGRFRDVPRGFLVGTAAAALAYLTIAKLALGLRAEQFFICALMLGTCIWNDNTRKFFTAMLPLALVGVIYDVTRVFQPLVRALTVHIAEPYQFDKRFLGIQTAAGRLTPNEFFAIHHWPALDFVTGLSYILYIYWVTLFGFYLFFFRRSSADQRLLRRFGWTFLLMNLVGFATYYIYPAAPPWYVAAHGFGPPDFSVRASPAAAIRWDQLTGLNYFSSFYARSADVFGAIPSLHVAYPLAVALFALELRKPWLNVAMFAFFGLVSFSAVYLQHHYVLDVFLGWGYAVAGFVGERAARAWCSAVPAAAVVPVGKT